MWEDELTRKLEAAVIGGSSDPATVHFLLEHPMLKPGSEGPVPMSDREMLATLPSSVLNLHDDECEACRRRARATMPSIRVAAAALSADLYERCADASAGCVLFALAVRARSGHPSHLLRGFSCLL